MPAIDPLSTEVLIVGADLLGQGRADLLLREGRFADPTTPQGRVLALVENFRATEDGRIKAHNVLRGKRDAARLKHWPGGPPPFGYRLQSVMVESQGRQVRGVRSVDNRIEGQVREGVLGPGVRET